MRASDGAFAALGAAVIGFGVLLSLPEPPPTLAVVRVAPLELPSALKREVLSPGETLGPMLARLGVAASEAPGWIAAATTLLDPRSLPAGLVAESLIDYHGIVRSLRLTPDWRSTVVLERGSGGISARRESRPVERELAVVSGVIRSSLFEGINAAGEGDELAVALADLFQWDIDFHRGLRGGDRFSLLVERVRSDGRTVAYGPVAAAEFVNDGRRYVALRFAHDGATGYYDGSGRPLRKQFLRTPLRVSRITSRFSTSRLHPVLGKRVPHWGVDYGAPVGTPVMATASGVVSYRGWKGGGGNTVELRHAGGWTTAYLHLSRFAPAAKVGARVDQGQVIGFVGSTGLSTGPHLDYRVTRNGRYLNPLSIGSEPAPPLPKDSMPAFSAWAQRLLPLLESAGSIEEAMAAALRAEAPVRLDG